MDYDLIFNGGQKNNRFPDPFILPSHSFVPKNLETALDFALMLYYMNSRYRQVSNRVVSHFITDIDLTAAHDKGGMAKEDRNDHYDYLTTKLGLFEALHQLGSGWAIFGNGFMRMHFPFIRLLIDDRGDHRRWYSLSQFEDRAKYHYKDMMYEIPDPLASGPLAERPRIKLKFQDRMDQSDKGRDRVRPVMLDPKRIVIHHAHASRRNWYIYKFEDRMVQDIKDGVMYQVNETPMDMLRAIANDQDFLFEDGEIFHFKAPTSVGLDSGGWGIPETLLNYRELHMLQVYRKIDEQVGHDYMLPFRVFSPLNNSSNIGEAIMDTNLDMWVGKIGKMIKDHRRDPMSYHAFPFPLAYAEHGLSGKNLVPKDLIEYQDNALIDSMGYPAELYRGSLAVQQIPTTLRLFESSFFFLHMGFQRACQWVSNKVLTHFGSDPVEVQLQKPTMADDLEARHIYLQLAAGGEISREKAYGPFGIKDPQAEMERRMEEDLEAEAARKKKQEEFEKREMLGSMTEQIAASQPPPEQGPAGAPGPGGGVPAPSGANTPLDIQQQAQQMAQQALQIQSDGERRKFLQQIEASNPTLHAATKQQMEEIRSQGESAGRQQIVDQIQQGG